MVASPQTAHSPCRPATLPVFNVTLQTSTHPGNFCLSGHDGSGPFDLYAEVLFGGRQQSEQPARTAVRAKTDARRAGMVRAMCVLLGGFTGVWTGREFGQQVRRARTARSAAAGSRSRSLSTTARAGCPLLRRPAARQGKGHFVRRRRQARVHSRPRYERAAPAVRPGRLVDAAGDQAPDPAATPEPREGCRPEGARPGGSFAGSTPLRTVLSCVTEPQPDPGAARGTPEPDQLRQSAAPAMSAAGYPSPSYRYTGPIGSPSRSMVPL